MKQTIVYVGGNWKYKRPCMFAFMSCLVNLLLCSGYVGIKEDIHISRTDGFFKQAELSHLLLHRTQK